MCGLFLICPYRAICQGNARCATKLQGKKLSIDLTVTVMCEHLLQRLPKPRPGGAQQEGGVSFRSLVGDNLLSALVR